MAFLGPTRNVESIAGDEIKSYYLSSTTPDERQTILYEPDINFSTGLVKISHHDNIKTYEKLFKYKLPVEENLKIEHSVENYIFFIESLTYHHNDLDKLRRLNI